MVRERRADTGRKMQIETEKWKKKRKRKQKRLKDIKSRRFGEL